MNKVLSAIIAEIVTDNFRSTIYGYFREHERSFPWRYHPDPYAILLSEIMLQQTQTSRVIDKFTSFLKIFPNFSALATASNADLLSQWQGLGYNRRALNLQKTARVIDEKYQGHLPIDYADLLTLPGIGPATAGALCVYAFNQPQPFIETNIRTVFIQFFFKNESSVSDRQIMPLVEETIDTQDPRRWFYALTDYGVYLKKTLGNLSTKSLHYHVQTPFLHSRRQLRGQIIKILISGSETFETLSAKLTDWAPEMIKEMCHSLAREGLIKVIKNRVQL